MSGGETLDEVHFVGSIIGEEMNLERELNGSKEE